jgi:hypothetical protein
MDLNISGSVSLPVVICRTPLETVDQSIDPQNVKSVEQQFITQSCIEVCQVNFKEPLEDGSHFVCVADIASNVRRALGLINPHPKGSDPVKTN